jgi:hypothetical protein
MELGQSTSIERRVAGLFATEPVFAFHLGVEAAYEAEPFRHGDCGAIGVVGVVCAVRLLPVLDGLPVATFEA